MAITEREQAGGMGRDREERERERNALGSLVRIEFQPIKQ